MPDEKESPEEVEVIKEIEGIQDPDGVERKETLAKLEVAKEGEKIAFGHGTYMVKEGGVVVPADLEEK